MTTPQEIFDYLTAKYPKSEVKVHQNLDSGGTVNYFSVDIDGNYSTTATTGSIEKMIAKAESNMPTPQQAAAKLRERAEQQRKAAAELTAKAEAIEKELAV